MSWCRMGPFQYSSVFVEIIGTSRIRTPDSQIAVRHVNHSAIEALGSQWKIESLASSFSPRFSLDSLESFVWVLLDDLV